MIVDLIITIIDWRIIVSLISLFSLMLVLQLLIGDYCIFDLFIFINVDSVIIDWGIIVYLISLF